MHGLRSPAGIAAATAGAIALLWVPVVAVATGPPDAVGGGTQTAGTVVPPAAKVPNPPPGQANKPELPAAPQVHPDSPGHAQGQAPQAEPPGSAHRPEHAAVGHGPQHATPAHGNAPSGETGDGSAEPAAGSAELGGAVDGAVEERSSSGSPDARRTGGGADLLPRADTSESGGGAVAGETLGGKTLGDAVELPADASPATLPFTGLQLALLALAGCAAAAAGLTLRRTARR
jgi:hypothetical protein